MSFFRRKATGDRITQKTFFIHISKTGGTSLRHALVEALGEKAVAFVSTADDYRSISDVRKLKVVGGHYTLWQFLGRRDLQVYPWTIFCVVRHPVRRLVSLYNYLSESSHPDHAIFRGLGLEDFCQLYASFQRPDLYMSYYFARSCRYSDVRRAIQLNRVAVYTMEQLDVLAETLSDTLGCKISLKHRNKSVVKVKVEDLDNINLDFLEPDFRLHEDAVNGVFPHIQSVEA